MKNFTIIPNEILGPSQLSINARYLFCLLRKYCGQKEACFPGQKKLGVDMNLTSRQVRNLLKELIDSGLISSKRFGWNKANSYTVSKELKIDRKGISYHLGSLFPLHDGNTVPPKNTYLKERDKRSIKGMESLREILVKKGIK